MTDFQSLTLEHLRALRAEVADVKADTHDIKAQMTVIRAYIADQHTEQNLLNSRLAAAELKIDRIERRLSLSDD